MKFIAGLMLVPLVFSLTCYKYECSDTKLDQNQCIKWDAAAGLEKLQSCDEASLYCPYEDTPADEFCKTKTPIQTLKWPGDECEKSEDCHGKNAVCDNYICVGAKLGEDCSSNTTVCDLGLHCSSADFKCRAQLGEGEECFSTYDCQNGFVCSLFKCVKYHSVDNEQLTDICYSNSWLSPSCASGTCAKTDSLGVFKCIPGFKGSAIPKLCTSDSDCIGTSGQYQIQGTCLCAHNKNGTSYCNAFTGEYPYLDAIEKMKKVVGLDQGVCYTQDRLNQQIWGRKMSPDNQRLLYDFNYDLLYAGQFAQIQDADHCSKEIFHADLWAAELALQIKCNAYICKPKNINFETDQCIYWDKDNTYELETCKKDKLCTPTEAEKNVTCAVPVPSEIKGYPGMKCKKDTDCVTNKCSGKNVCEGAALNMSCNEHYECDLGLQCWQGQCKQQVKEKDSCLEDYNCQNDMMCNNKVCIKYWSLNVSDPIDKCVDGVSGACSSGSCAQKSQTQFVCVPEYKTVGKIPYQCSFSDQCQGLSSEGYSIQGECSCAHDKDALAYCSIFAGDQPYQDQLEAFKKIQGKDQGKCHTQVRYQEACWKEKFGGSDLKNFYRYLEKHYYAFDYPGLAKSDECTQQIYFSPYWDAKQKASGFLTTISSLLLLLVLIAL